MLHRRAEASLKQALHPAHAASSVDHPWADDELVGRKVHVAVGVRSGIALRPLDHAQVFIDFIQPAAHTRARLVRDVGCHPTSGRPTPSARRRKSRFAAAQVFCPADSGAGHDATEGRGEASRGYFLAQFDSTSFGKLVSRWLYRIGCSAPREGNCIMCLCLARIAARSWADMRLHSVRMHQDGFAMTPCDPLRICALLCAAVGMAYSASAMGGEPATSAVVATTGAQMILLDFDGDTLPVNRAGDAYPMPYDGAVHSGAKAAYSRPA